VGAGMREVLQGDAVEWMRRHGGEGSVITSPPDAEPMGMTLEEWLPWFRFAVKACLWTAGDAHPAIFYMSDRKREGRLLSKGAEVMFVARSVRMEVLWHKIVLRKPVGAVNLHRPGWDHLIAVGGKGCRPGAASPDVMERGPALWMRGFGINPARVAVDLAMIHGGPVIAPFCGRGTILAVAEDAGLDSVGIDTDPECVEYARTAGVPK
jgi:hypothetical protein